ncbi:beta-ketoacyl-[acyl-carrier-protein] synthase family protein [Pseudooceanicola sp.]|uniref:beta-ketoacyl-[acyl-carrier-protein] synthase family protein n=1 Tax=Pseudooceanicola sp. TaxID=1914328 RepID=UPI0026266777|nr:beta-ketoacyl-[acyl-carrier-protein] synthase family protein [Pseudooceanicola sp.]MDF1855790.1 beta-ketoacyl-[acyl-carrier-protein] synthase family protein [Pseudooceanicola sp.]
MKRVVITGAGTVNALGLTVPETFEAMREGRCGIRDLVFRDVEKLSIRIGGQVPNYPAEDDFSRKDTALFDRFTMFTIHAAREAVAQSGLVFDGELAEKSGVILGTAGGGATTWDDSYYEVYHQDKNRVHPFVIPKLMPSAAASHVSIAHSLQGPSFTVSTACASSNHAMSQAFQMVRSGMAPVMLTGGSESMLCYGGVKSWEGLRVMSRDGCRPFSANRNGMVQGEGAGVFVFEEMEHAKQRGAEILAEVIGFAMSSDASDIVMPSQQGAVRAMTGTLRDARINPEDVGYINAHGTGTAVNDKTECAAIADAFGSHADKLMVSSTKSMHGHLIGGTGAVELLACIMALKDGVVAPTVGYDQPDPDCPLDVVPNVAREAQVEVAMSNAFSFGGLNAVIALRRA